VNLAGSHYIWDSAAFWPAATIIVGLLTIVATVLVTLRTANLKRRLYYMRFGDTPLIRRRQDLSEQLIVTYGGGNSTLRVS
jgi:formate hydrogenlyase subunit 3/multisubunit Na+/H+ antiporter MnhD subunit